jgi:shikimate dehydrogenase
MKHFKNSTILSLSDLQQTKIFENKELFALIGNPVSKSISHITHNEVFSSLQFNGHFFRIHVEEDELSIAIPYLHKKGFKGLCVTMPFKEKVLPYLINQSDIGSVNTLIFQKEGFYGKNTDALAIEKILSPFFCKSPYVSLIGAGGCAKAAAYIFNKYKIPFTVYNRTVEKGATLSKNYGSLEDFHSPRKGLHIVINTTSVGMGPYNNNSPIDTTKFSPSTIVFETIYQPWKTKLILDAQAKGLPVILGIEMFIAQAIFQFGYFLPISFEETKVSNIIRNSIKGSVYDANFSFFPK